MHPSLTRRAAKAASWTLANGAKIPNIGFGTWKMSREQASASVAHALKTGYRHLDCAWAYRNEDGVGEAIRKSGVNRDELFVTSKLWNTFHGDNVEAGLDATLKDLGLDHLDLYLMHWPVAFANPNQAQISSLKSQTGRPVEEVSLSNDLALTWSRMEEMVKKGKIRNIGISNFNIRRTEELLKHATIAPVINQVEVNWGVANEELLHYSEAHQIMLQAYSPLGGSNNVNEYLDNPVVQDVAQRNNMTPAQVMLAWPLARGIVPIVKSNTPERVEQNLETANLKLPWDDVVHLTRESQVGGIERSVDPTEAWATAADIFEDGKDQERLLSLKDTTLEVPPAHEAAGHHFLEPRNDPAAPVLGPGGVPVRSFHSLAHAGSSSRIARPTAVQVALNRHFSSTPRPRYAATAEAEPPSTSEAPAVSASPLLAQSSKAALRTPGLAFTDGEQGVARETRKMNLYTAVRDAQSHALASDETACVFGEDVAFGGVFRSTMGLETEYGKERVFNMPLTEQGIVGFGIGLAAMGQTAIAEIQFADYMLPAYDQIVNEAAKYNYRSGGQHKVGKLTIRSPCMGVGHGALYHSQSIEQLFIGVPGVKVIIPRSPIQAKGLLLAAIRDDNPCIFLEPKILYRASVEHVPVDDFTLPLSSAEVLEQGDSITLLSWGAPLYSCVEAINLLRDPPASIAAHIPADVRKARVELLDLRTILPWDRETVAQSVLKTGRCVIVHEAPVTGGVGAEIGAHIQDRCFLRLEAPVCRIGAWDTPFPHVHETFYKPGALRIVDALVRTLKY